MIEAYLRANNMFVDYNEVHQPCSLHVWGFGRLLSGFYLTSFAL